MWWLGQGQEQKRNKDKTSPLFSVHRMTLKCPVFTAVLAFSFSDKKLKWTKEPPEMRQHECNSKYCVLCALQCPHNCIQISLAQNILGITVSQQATQPSYHDAREETHRLATGGVGRHIPVAHCKEGDGYEPQSCRHVACCFLGLPAGWKTLTWNKLNEILDK